MPKRTNATEKVEAKVKERPSKVRTIKKSPLEDTVKKYLTLVNPEIEGKIQESLERVLSAEGEKTNVLFVRFSASSEDKEVDDEANIEVMKEILFHYHTAPEKVRGGKALVIEVVPSTEDDPHTMCFYEVS